jgi:hypothetical protein
MVHVRFTGVDLSRVRGCFEEIGRRARVLYTSSVCAGPEDFDPKVVGLEAMVEAFARGNLVAASVHSELELGRLTCAFLLTILRKTDGVVEGRGYTRQGLLREGRQREGRLRPAAVAREKFGVLVRHAIDIEGMLGASAVHIGPNGRTPLGEGGWVGV